MLRKGFHLALFLTHLPVSFVLARGLNRSTLSLYRAPLYRPNSLFERKFPVVRKYSTTCEEPPRENGKPQKEEEEDKPLSYKDREPLSPKQLLIAYGDLVKLRLSGKSPSVSQTIFR